VGGLCGPTSAQRREMVGPVAGCGFGARITGRTVARPRRRKTLACCGLVVHKKGSSHCALVRLATGSQPIGTHRQSRSQKSQNIAPTVKGRIADLKLCITFGSHAGFALNVQLDGWNDAVLTHDQLDCRAFFVRDTKSCLTTSARSPRHKAFIPAPTSFA
jgi:hypothetical protein